MEKYGLIGHPLGHSFSRNFFSDKFENEGIKAQYLNFDISSIDELPNVLAANPELKGPYAFFCSAPVVPLDFVGRKRFSMLKKGGNGAILLFTRFQ